MTKDNAIAKLKHWRFGLRLDTTGIIELIEKRDAMLKQAVQLLAKEACPGIAPGENGCDLNGCEAHWMKELKR